MTDSSIVWIVGGLVCAMSAVFIASTLFGWGF